MVVTTKTRRAPWLGKRNAKPQPVQPKCGRPIPRCEKAGHHQPVCRCVLDLGHEGAHASEDWNF